MTDTADKPCWHDDGPHRFEARHSRIPMSGKDLGLLLQNVGGLNEGVVLEIIKSKHQPVYIGDICTKCGTWIAASSGTMVVPSAQVGKTMNVTATADANHNVRALLDTVVNDLRVANESLIQRHDEIAASKQIENAMTTTLVLRGMCE